MTKPAQLLTLQDMREKFRRGDDPFDVTVEKWGRIRKFAETATGLEYFQELLQGANVGVPFCFEYQVKGCLGCPLGKICGRGGGKRFLQIMRLTQAYALAGDMLPKQILVSEIEDFVMELEVVRAKHKGVVH